MKKLFLVTCLTLGGTAIGDGIPSTYETHQSLYVTAVECETYLEADPLYAADLRITVRFDNECEVPQTLRDLTIFSSPHRDFDYQVSIAQEKMYNCTGQAYEPVEKTFNVRRIWMGTTAEAKSLQVNNFEVSCPAPR